MSNSNIRTVLNLCVNIFQSIRHHKPIIGLSYLFVFMFSAQTFFTATDICISCGAPSSEVISQHNLTDIESSHILKRDQAHEECLDCQSTSCCSLLMFASTPMKSYSQKTAQLKISFECMQFEPPYYAFLRPPKV